MVLRTPMYYKNFKCIADKCSDNCCIGWEIDIDDNTADLYEKVSGDFGIRLQNNIVHDDIPHFILGKGDRCPFLNEHNLCDIILNLGEDKLCQICTDHPRYYEWFYGVKECGIGLSCEEAARIILSCNEPFSYYDKVIPDEECDYCDIQKYNHAVDVRDKLIGFLQDKDTPLKERLILIDKFSLVEDNFLMILELMYELEPIDENWQPYMKSCIEMYDKVVARHDEFYAQNSVVTDYLRNIAIYFVWRYFLKGIFDDDFISKNRLAVLSVYVIEYMFMCRWIQNGTLTFEDCVQIAKDYSKQVEYSEENVLAVMNM